MLLRARAVLGPERTASLATFEALCPVAYDAERTAKDEGLIWLAACRVDKLSVTRGPGESYRDVILRLAGKLEFKV
jgi:hypothetical protein